MGAPRAERVSSPSFLVAGDPLGWDVVETRLRDAREYWVASVRPDGRPHTRPVWGIWWDHRLVLSPGGGYWIMRNVVGNPEVSVNLGEATGLVVVVEGVARVVAEPPWKRDAIAVYDEKYAISYAEMWDYGTIEVAPRRVYAWRSDAEATGSGTRFLFS